MKQKQTCQNCKHKPTNEYELVRFRHIDGQVCFDGELWEPLNYRTTSPKCLEFLKNFFIEF